MSCFTRRKLILGGLCLGASVVATDGAVVGEGDARQRATRAAFAATVAGGVVLALLAMLT